MAKILAPLLLIAALALHKVAADTCAQIYAKKAVVADTEELKCIALNQYSRCVADAALSLSPSAANALYADLQAAQDKLSIYNCAAYPVVELPKIQTRSNDLLFTTNPSNNIFFVRYRKDSASITRMQDGIASLRANVTAAISASAARADIQTQNASAILAAKIAGVRSELDLRFAVTAASVSSAQAAAATVISRLEVDNIMNNAIFASQARQDAARNTTITNTRAQQRTDFTNRLQNFSVIQTEMNTDRNNTLLDSSLYLAQARSDYNAIALDAQTKVNASIASFNQKEAGILPKLTYNITNTPLEGVACNASQTGRFRIYETVPGTDVDPGSSQDDLNGARINLQSYSHGSGYSISRNEIWTPQWSGSTIYRFNPDTLQQLGTFSISRGEIMQCAGDDQDFIYAAHWGWSIICKYGPYPSNTNSQQWCYNVGGTAAGVAVDSRYVYGVQNSNSIIYVIDRSTGNNVKNLVMQNWPGGGSYGIAINGNRFWWMYPNQAVEYDLTDGSRRRTFSLADSPYAVFSAPDRFCFSPNSDFFLCYRTRTIVARGYGYVCNGERYIRI